MKVIFLDVSGVLNDTNSFNDYINHYYLFVNDNSIKGYDSNKFDLLSLICMENDAGVVLSSSWKFYYSIQDKFDNELTRILKEFKKHNIPFYGFTPDLKTDDIKGRETWNENNIQEYLDLHPEIESFCILATDDYSLERFQDNRVYTSYNEDGKGNGGLLLHHENEIGKILSKKHK